jgi:hypothetical protein
VRSRLAQVKRCATSHLKFSYCPYGALCRHIAASPCERVLKTFSVLCSYSTVFLGSPGVGAPLSCYKVYEKPALQARHWLNISRECCILSRLQEARWAACTLTAGVIWLEQQ